MSIPIPRGLVLALDLFRAPVLAEVMRTQPLLPSKEMLVLLRIAGGCTETSRNAVTCTGESPERIKRAVVLYLKQILLFPDADSYRVLGVDPQAPHATIREHLHWMMRWLHPDRNHNTWESLFASRVLSAWEDLKSPQRREAYNRLRYRPIGSAVHGSRTTTRRRGIPWVATPLPPGQPNRLWLRLSVLIFVLGLTAWLLLSHKLPPNLSADEAELEKAVGAPARADEILAEPKGTDTGLPGN